MKKLSAALLFGALVLTACGGGDKPPTGASGSSPVTAVGGTVVELDPNQAGANLKTVPWTGGAGEVVMLNVANGETLANTPLSASGSFSLSLPANLPAEQLDTLDQSNEYESCSGSFKLSDPNARGLEVLFSVNASKSGAIVPVNVSNQPTGLKGLIGGFLYVDRNVSIVGSKTCSYDNVSYTNARDLNLIKGWNYITADYSYQGNSNNSASVKYATGKIPNSQWIYVDAAFPAMKAQGLF